MERLKYVVYQRRMGIEAIKTKAMLLAMLGNAEGAATAAQEYFELIMPTTQEAAEQKKVRERAMLERLEKMGPLRYAGGRLTMPAKSG